MQPEIVSLSLSRNNSKALQEIMKTLSTLEEGEELVSVFFLTSKEDESFQVGSISSKGLSEGAADAMADSILFTLKYLSEGEGEIIDG